MIKLLNNCYAYDSLEQDLKEIKNRFPDTCIFPIGKSVLGRDIYALKLGRGSRRIFYSGAYHGMESLTAKVLVTFAAEFCGMIAAGNVPDILDGTALYIVPMVNPDGVEIAASGERWQANSRGVDINHNFDALWELSKKTEEKYGVTGPGPTRYGGEYPESEPETKAIADFTRENRFDTVIALHSQGEVIYYDFCGYIPDGTEEILNRFESVSQYKRDKVSGIASYGGYKDWFIRKFKKPGFTIEVGLGRNPLPLSEFDEIYAGVREILFNARG